MHGNSFFFFFEISHWTWIIYNAWGLCRWCASCFFPCIVLQNPSQGSWTRWFGVAMRDRYTWGESEIWGKDVIPASSRSEANYLVNFTQQPSSDQNPEFYWPIVGLITNWCRQPYESHSIIEWHCWVNPALPTFEFSWWIGGIFGSEKNAMDWNDGFFYPQNKIFLYCLPNIYQGQVFFLGG